MTFSDIKDTNVFYTMASEKNFKLPKIKEFNIHIYVFYIYNQNMQ